MLKPATTSTTGRSAPSRRLQTCKSSCRYGQANRHHCTGLHREDIEVFVYQRRKKKKKRPPAISTAGRARLYVENGVTRGKAVTGPLLRPRRSERPQGHADGGGAGAGARPGEAGPPQLRGTRETQPGGA